MTQVFVPLEMATRHTAKCMCAQKQSIINFSQTYWTVLIF